MYKNNKLNSCLTLNSKAATDRPEAAPVPAKPDKISTIIIIFSLVFHVCILQTWALALFFQIRSPLILIPWIAIALSLILQIFRFAHCSIALKKTSGLLLLKSAKKLNRSQKNSGSLTLAGGKRNLTRQIPSA